MTWVVELTDAARDQLIAVADKRERRLLVTRLRALTEEPDKQGKALTAELRGYRSVRAVGQRYRIIYRLERDRIVVIVVTLGRRQKGGKRDVYSLARKLIRLRLVEPETAD